MTKTIGEKLPTSTKDFLDLIPTETIEQYLDERKGKLVIEE